MGLNYTQQQKDILWHGSSAAGLRHALRIAHMNPANTPLIFDLNHHDFAPTPFGRFLFEVSVAVEKILRRNVGLYSSAIIDDDAARAHAFEFLGLKRRPAFIDEKRRKESDFRDNADEISRLPRLFSPTEIVDIINLFAWTSHAKEQPNHINQLIEAWRYFRRHAADNPLFSKLLPFGPFLDELAANGITGTIELAQKSPTSHVHIERTLYIHEQCAIAHGTEPRTDQIRSILKKYKGIMRPIVIPYRKLAPEVVATRRKQFSEPHAYNQGTRAQFLHSLQDPELRMALYRLGFPLNKFQAMSEKSSFGQKAGEKNPHYITVEHMAPLSTSDNFIENFALSTAGANEDTNRLVKLQTDFLPTDRVSYSPSMITWEFVAPAVDIVTLRPPFLNYGGNKKFPSFMKHADWDKNLG